MWGMGNRSEPSGPDETSERSLFKVLETKNANRSRSGGMRRAASHRSSGRKALWLCVVVAVIARGGFPVVVVVVVVPSFVSLSAHE